MKIIKKSFIIIKENKHVFKTYFTLLPIVLIFGNILFLLEYTILGYLGIKFIIFTNLFVSFLLFLLCIGNKSVYFYNWGDKNV